MQLSNSELIDTQWDVNPPSSKSHRYKLGINRYIVGCKLRETEKADLSSIELIDTQWDVNMIVAGDGSATTVELIDTQWDVNLLATYACPFLNMN